MGVTETGASGDSRLDEAEHLLADLLARREAGEDAGLDALVGERPDLASELRQMWSQLGLVDRALEADARRRADERARVEAVLNGLVSSKSFAERYAVESEIGRGGMGAILRVLDRKLDRSLAMKLIVGQAAAAPTGKTPPTDARQLARFLNEARITSQLDHPGIVPVHELGVDEQGRAYFTMKLVQGMTLSEVFERRSAGDERWSTARVLGLIERVCEALAFAHGRGVIHRDLKPHNVMVGDFGEVYVMDWGLARRLGEPEEHAGAGAAVDEQLAEQTTRTGQGHVLGTPAYMSPEQARGEIERMGPQSDVYAIGAMLYRLIAGHAPYTRPGEKASGSETLARVVTGPPRRLESRTTPPELIAICARAMNYDQEGRYASVRELADDLQRFLAGRAVRAFRTGAWVELQKWVQRNTALSTALAIAVLAITLGAIGFAYKASEATEASIIAQENAEEAGKQARIAKANEERAAQSEKRALSGEAQANEERERAERKADEVLRLSALQKLEDLEAEADRLWPAIPENLLKYEDWLKRARELVGELPEHERKLTELRAKSVPWTAEEQARHRAEHPKLAELESAKRHKTFIERLRAALESGVPARDPEPAEVGVDLVSLPASAIEVNDLAWPLIDPDRKDWGGEAKGLVLARRAVELAAELPAEERAGIRDSLAWGLFANGRFDEAVAEEELDPEKEAERAKHLAELEDHIATLEAEISKRPEWLFADAQDKWWHNQLEKLVEGLKVFSNPETGLAGRGTSAEHGWGVAKRVDFAGSIAERSTTGAEASARWTEVIASLANVAECPLYGGLGITPQLGLLPIGRDPQSGLWEFAHLQTGNPAARGPDGKLILTESTGLVFVLLPGGTFRMGAQANDQNGANYDPAARSDEDPVHAVRLSPFFLSKYEMTQGQWLHFVGRNPSQNGPHHYQTNWNRSGRIADLVHPVERISWTECAEILGRLGLEMPSEAQWEYGARGGTTTIWWTGNETKALAEAGNVSDKYAKDNGTSIWGNHDLDLDDGNTIHARVGSYRANPFGMHDVIGNLSEWCQDGYRLDYYRQGPQENPLSDPEGRPNCVYRGGGYGYGASRARSAARDRDSPGNADDALGVRPARRITP